MQVLKKCLANPQSDLVTLLKQAEATPQYIADSLWLLNLQKEYAADGGQRQNFVKLCKLLSMTNLFDEELMVQTLDFDLLAAISHQFDEQALKRTQQIATTKLSYRQDKCKLLQESSEGYSKVMSALLFGDLQFKKIQRLIGAFKLDPVRVMDLLLVAMHGQSDVASLVEILKSLRFESAQESMSFVLCTLIGRQLVDDVSCQQSPYLAVGVKLINHGCVEFQDMLAECTPSRYTLECFVAELFATDQLNEALAVVGQDETLLKCDIVHQGILELVYRQVSRAVQQGASPELLSNYLPLLDWTTDALTAATELLVDLVSLTAREFTMCTDKDMRNQWLTVLTKYILPTVSCSKSEQRLSVQVWELLKKLSFRNRYMIYDEWLMAYGDDERMTAVKEETIAAAKKIMRRVSKENVDMFGPEIAALCACNPILTAGVVLDQLQVYENMVAPMVLMLHTLNPLSYDVFSYVLISKLAATDKLRMKLDGTNTSSWLMSLSSFAGMLYAQHATMELDSILLYILAQCRLGATSDLLLLSELIKNMSGRNELAAGASDQQLELHCGGKAFQSLVTQPATTWDVTASISRLVTAIRSTEIAAELISLIAKMRISVVYREVGEGQHHLKLITSEFDVVSESLIQLVNFLAAQLAPDELTALGLSVKQLLENGVDIESAFHIMRSVISRQEMDLSKWSQLIDETAVHIVGHVSSSIAKFYAMFWLMGVDDIYVPSDKYEQEILRLEAELEIINKSGNYYSQAITAKLELIEPPLQALRKNFASRQQQHTAMAGIIKEFVAHAQLGADYSQILARSCFSARALYSAADAFYSAKMLWYVHQLKLPNFDPLAVIDSAVEHLPLALINMSQYEAMNFGIFLQHSMALSASWYIDLHAFADSTLGAGMTHDELVQRVESMHDAITLSACISLKSGEYLQMRNAILVLDRISSVYPILQQHGTPLQQCVVELVVSETREDLKAMLTRYKTILYKNRAQWGCKDIDVAMVDRQEQSLPNTAVTYDFQRDRRSMSNDVPSLTVNSKMAVDKEEDGQLSPDEPVPPRKDSWDGQTSLNPMAEVVAIKQSSNQLKAAAPQHRSESTEAIRGTSRDNRALSQKRKEPPTATEHNDIKRRRENDTRWSDDRRYSDRRISDRHDERIRETGGRDEVRRQDDNRRRTYGARQATTSFYAQIGAQTSSQIDPYAQQKHSQDRRPVVRQASYDRQRDQAPRNASQSDTRPISRSNPIADSNDTNRLRTQALASLVRSKSPQQSPRRE